MKTRNAEFRAKPIMRLAIIAFAAVLTAALVTSCAPSPAAPNASSASSNSSSSSQSASSRADDKMQHDSSNASAQQQYIDMQAALDIALADAKLAKDAVIVKENQIEPDGNYVVYDIEFLSGNIEYEYVINAVTGDIIKASSESLAALGN